MLWASVSVFLFLGFCSLEVQSIQKPLSWVMLLGNAGLYKNSAHTWILSLSTYYLAVDCLKNEWNEYQLDIASVFCYVGQAWRKEAWRHRLQLVRWHSFYQIDSGLQALELQEADSMRWKDIFTLLTVLNKLPLDLRPAVSTKKLEVDRGWWDHQSTYPQRWVCVPFPLSGDH